jgi:hypothetical protein
VQLPRRSFDFRKERSIHKEILERTNSFSSFLSRRTNERLVPICDLAGLALDPWMPAERPGPYSQSDDTAASADWSEMVASMERMHVAMGSVERSNNSDMDFVRLMLPHHQAAIDMAKTQLAYGKDPQIRRLAQEIITDQQSEIEQMQLWLKRRELDSSKIKQTPSLKSGKER